MNRTVLIAGITITATLLGVLLLSLGNDPQHIDSPLIGRPATPFALKVVDTGETLDLARFRGKPVVLNFWATWCRPCWEEHPTLTAMSQMMGGRVQFVGVVFQDEQSRILEFLRQRGSAYPTVVDVGGRTAIAYGVGGVPETFVLDANGIIVAKHDGPVSAAELQSYLVKAMKP